ncbi:3-hydroxyisobutyryl-CoA hydrolase-like protein 1, mitochondrial [Silene latifolia]|uniref:3-hydroxyisobutyryl-CoA hydrolase-like protein 1, mitochondrial n=1 Tax=Silene latifolia TaxID=37657 RepID=UPI003D76ABAF
MKVTNVSKSLYSTALDLTRYSNLSLDEDDSDTSVLVKTIGECKLAILNRPQALNAIDNTVVVPLLRLYRLWETDPNVGIVILKGNGPAFSAGGDVVKIYHKLIAGKLEECKNIFRVTYTLIHLTSCFCKPNVAIWNGLTVGSGSGISALSRFRIATDKTVFSLPETQIGLHPDSGASYYLPRLPGYLGEYLALTGDRLNGSELLACGLATHFVLANKIPLIEENLAQLETNDESAVRRLLDSYSDDPAHLHAKSILNRMEMINECFGCDTVEGIIDALENKASGADKVWCTSVVKKLKTASPLCLKVALKSIRLGRSQTIEQCLVREYWMTVQAFHGIVSKDFYEGVRSRLVDKTFSPKWNPASLDQVSEERVNQYFSALSPTELPLELPVDLKQILQPSTIRFENSFGSKKSYNLVQARL